MEIKEADVVTGEPKKRATGGSGPRLAVVSTYVPRACGIATFARDLVQAIHRVAGEERCRIYALDDRPEGYDYPPEVAGRILAPRVADYRRAAEAINFSRAEVVVVQHEFGIFGGDAGSHLTSLLARLTKPVVTVCHTALRDPDATYRRAMEEVIHHSEALVVLSRVGGEILQEVYGVAPERIRHIHHGVPELPGIDRDECRRHFGVSHRFVLLTFGLLSENKGIESAIEALPPVVEDHPELLYVVLGATHPAVRRREGERYRLALERRVRDLGLEGHVVFHDRFVSQEELGRYLAAADAYCTPYRYAAQVASGTLAFAIGMGLPVVSTPYWYAREMLAEGRGILVDFGDNEALSAAIRRLVEEPETRTEMARRSAALGAEMGWSRVAQRYLTVCAEVVEQTRRRRTPLKPPRATLPELRLDHLRLLTDDVGIIQHTVHGIPDRAHGYSADDVGRALAVVCRLWEETPREAARRRLLPLATSYLAFLHHAETPDGHFHNFMGYDRRFLDERGSGDTLGRVVWGLGWAVRVAPTAGIRALAAQMIERTRPRLAELTPLRSRAYAICGLAATRNPEDEGLIRHLAEGIVAAYEATASEAWSWFEERLTYGNAKVCEALLHAHRRTGEPRYREVALAALDHLTACQLTEGPGGEAYFDLVGNRGWYARDGARAHFDQQPIDAGYLVEAYVMAHQVTGEERYMELAHTAFEWFLGRNRLHEPLYDFSTGACGDGLEEGGVNHNQGAESTLCYLLARLALGHRRTPDAGEST